MGAYIDPNKNGTGKEGIRDIQGNEHGPYVVPRCSDGSAAGQLKIISKDITTADLTDNAYTFSASVDAVAVKNDGTSDITVTISTLIFTLKPGESRVLELASFTVVAFSAGAVFRMNGLRRV